MQQPSAIERPKRRSGPDPIDVEVGRRIRIQRTVRGISQSTLGRALGITFQQVQKYEKGTNRVGAGRLTRIAKELDVPVGALLGADGEGPKQLSDGSNTLQYLAMPGAIRLLAAYAQIADKGTKTALIDLAERIAGVPVKPAQSIEHSPRSVRLTVALVALRAPAIGCTLNAGQRIAGSSFMKAYGFLLAGLLVAAPAFGEEAALKTAVDGTFAPHAMPKLGGGYRGLQHRSRRTRSASA